MKIRLNQILSLLEIPIELNHIFTADLHICLLSLFSLVKERIKAFQNYFCCYNRNLKNLVIDYFGTIVQKCTYLRNGFHGDDHMLSDSTACELRVICAKT